MVERDLITEVPNISLQVDSRAVDRISFRINELGIDCFAGFINDLHRGLGVYPVEIVESILDLIEEDVPGIITYNRKGKQNLLVIGPEGSFTPKGFTGVVATIEFWERKGDFCGTIDRSFVKPGDPTSYLDIETIDFKQTPANKSVVEVNACNYSRHHAVYQDGRLVSLNWRGYVDSTSFDSLTNTYYPEKGIWISAYTPAYGKPISLSQQGEMVDYHLNPQPGVQKKIGLSEIKEVNGMVSAEIKIKEKGEESSSLLIAPLKIPDYLLPACDLQGYLAYAQQHFQELYKSLSQRVPVISEIKA